MHLITHNLKPILLPNWSLQILNPVLWFSCESSYPRMCSYRCINSQNTAKISISAARRMSLQKIWTCYLQLTRYVWFKILYTKGARKKWHQSQVGDFVLFTKSDERMTRHSVELKEHKNYTQRGATNVDGLRSTAPLFRPTDASQTSRVWHSDVAWTMHITQTVKHGRVF